MLALEAVRAAVLSDKPWARLDALIRAELAAGQKTKSLYEALMGMADDVDGAPGLSDAGSDALGDALDALTGMCHPDSRYSDPPELTPVVPPLGQVIPGASIPVTGDVGS